MARAREFADVQGAPRLALPVDCRGPVVDEAEKSSRRCLALFRAEEVERKPAWRRVLSALLDKLRWHPAAGQGGEASS